jgi:hypothetical protein
MEFLCPDSRENFLAGFCIAMVPEDPGSALLEILPFTLASIALSILVFVEQVLFEDSITSKTCLMLVN